MLWCDVKNITVPEFFAVGDIIRALLLCALKDGVRYQKLKNLQFSRFIWASFSLAHFFIAYLTLSKLLGFENFTKILPICLADNGTEFSDHFGIEADSDGVIRSRLFYCDPSSPGQKGACENNHEFIRRIIPKSTDLGQYTQSQIDIMMDHINSYERPELGDKSPYEMFEFYYGKEILDLLGIHKIPANEIILKPELLKHK